MRKPSGREYFFIVVLCLCGLAYLAYRDDGRLFGGGQEEPKKSAAVGIAPMVRMADLVARTEDYDPRGRNLFEYYTPPPPRPARAATAPVRTAPKKPTVRPVNQQRQQRTRPEPTLQPPRITFKYIGYLGPKEDKIAVFEDSEGYLLARTGEVVDKEFTVVAFKYESVVMGYVDTRFKEMTTELNMGRN